MGTDAVTDSTTIHLLLPEVILVATATLMYVVGAFVRLRNFAGWAAQGAVILAAAALFTQGQGLGMFDGPPHAWRSGPLVVDLLAYGVRWGTLLVGALLIWLTDRRHDFEQSAEQVASLLLVLAGLMLAVTSDELILLFAGLELVSIPTYILLYIGRPDRRGQEAALKYFFLSILSSAVLLYGFSLLYGVAGSTRLSQIATAIGASNGGTDFGGALVPLAMLLIFAALAFRLAAVPFHFYAPDVYQGTSNTNAALLATLPKIVGLAVLARLMLTALPGWESLGWKIVMIASVVTMTLGNVLALWQADVRRLLAYSSVANAGYMLIGVSVALALRTTAPGTVAQPFDGLGAALFFLIVYVFATLGTFAAVVYLSGHGRQVDTLDQLAGLNRRHPWVALAIAAFMFSLTGIPPLAGFWGKFGLIFSALTLDQPTAEGAVSLRPWFVGLAIVAVVNAAIAAAYYLRVIGALYFRAPVGTPGRSERAAAPAVAMFACVAVVIGAGLFPGWLVEETNRAGRSVAPSAAGQHGGVAGQAEARPTSNKNASPGLPQPQGGENDGQAWAKISRSR